MSDLLAMTKDLDRYAVSGSEAALMRLQDHCCKISRASTLLDSRAEIVAVGDEFDASIVRACVVRLLETLFGGRHTRAAWECLTFLCSTIFHGGAHIILAELPEYPNQLYDRMLTHIAVSIAEGTHERKLGDCIALLIQFSESDFHVQAMSAHDTLRKAFWSFMDGRFFQTSQYIQGMAIMVAASFVCMIESKPVDHIRAALKDGALPIFVRVILHANNSSQGPKRMADGDWNLLFQCFQAVHALRPDKDPDIDASAYKLGRNDIFRFTLSVYARLGSVATVEDAHNATMLMTIVADYLLTFVGLDSGRDFLLFKPPRAESAKPLVVLIREVAHRSQSPLAERCIEKVLTAVKECGGGDAGGVADQITEALGAAAVPSPPARTDKDRHCAYPYCPVTGQGQVADMKKCGRCKSVYYCCEVHQKRHWREHKKVCTPK